MRFSWWLLIAGWKCCLPAIESFSENLMDTAGLSFSFSFSFQLLVFAWSQTKEAGVLMWAAKTPQKCWTVSITKLLCVLLILTLWGFCLSCKICVMFFQQVASQKPWAMWIKKRKQQHLFCELTCFLSSKDGRISIRQRACKAVTSATCRHVLVGRKNCHHHN